MMTVMCSWCEPPRVTGHKPGPDQVTHGICPDCFERLAPPLPNLSGPPGEVKQAGDCPGYGRELPPGWECPVCPIKQACYNSYEEKAK